VPHSKPCIVLPMMSPRGMRIEFLTTTEGYQRGQRRHIVMYRTPQNKKERERKGQDLTITCMAETQLVIIANSHQYLMR
jgi:hypothetical protein